MNVMRRATVISVFVLVVAGRSDDSESTTRDSASEKPSAVVVVAEEHRFVPGTVSIRAATDLRLDNVGSLAHNWNGSGAAGRERDRAHTRHPVGSCRNRTWAVVGLDGLAPGTYQVVRSIPGHFSAGMVGELVIGGI